MKKLLTIVFTCICGGLFAEGYQVNLQSAKQAGMGHTGTGMHLGSESMHFNPAGLSWLDAPVDVSLGVSGVMSKVKFTDPGDGYTASTDNGVSTPLYAFAAFRVYGDRISAGLAFTTPYGSTIDWGRDWRGASLIEDISLKSFVFQPTVSFRICPTLSVGGGLMVGMGSFDLSRALVGPGGPLPGYADVSPISLGLAGSADVAYGYNIGVMWDFAPRWTAGVSYRSKMMMKVNSDDSHVNPIDAAVAQMITVIPSLAVLNNLLDGQQFSTEIPMPWNFNVGLSFHATPCLLLALDAQIVGWSAYKELEFKFENYTSTSFKDYRNSITARFGAQYTFGEKWIGRAGVYFDQTPVRNQTYYPDGPGANKLGTSLGLSFKPMKAMSIDFAAAYLYGFEKTASCPAPTAVNPSARFGGKYHPTSFNGSLGVSLLF